MDNFFFTEKDIEIEKQQLIDEGKDISEVEQEFEILKKIVREKGPILNHEKIISLFKKCQDLPLRKDYSYYEPVYLEEIKREWGSSFYKKNKNLSDEEIKEKIYGGWFGRCAGCLLGKVFEGWYREKIRSFLKKTGQFPLKYYVSSDNIDLKIIENYKLIENFCVNKIKNMVEDDDLNYTVLALDLLENYGFGFTSFDFSKNFLGKIPILKTYTAERIVYKNLVNFISPENSASYLNPYREWIGAQIRADLYGYITPQKPEKGVALSYRDASVTHIRNGVYGALFITAMISIAFCEKDIFKIVEYGLNYLPQRSRLVQAIKEVVEYRKRGVSYEEVSNIIHQKWDEKNPHHWCHTISNTQIVLIGLLWGNGDFGESICKAVEIGFDTDCNGATVGSIMGIILGKRNLPKRWIDPLNDTLETGVSGFSKVKISELAERTYNIFKKGD
ncbi:MAG: ADP-ribosylglycohydrolase family protein [Candidatus Omnitrophica bacterium]|nr:ADP-ribosylglycohydrolase family protein [Candidatus Omnitrophota bacterium]MCM8802289.1 ADP-ribosylglycohydrolase family protein [Candidatus Omnitrophota bacterium]